MPLREPPHSEESELALLGCIMLRPVLLDRVVDAVRPGDFYRAVHRTIYEAILELHRAKDAIDAVTLFERLSRAGKAEDIGGLDFLLSLSETMPTAQNIGSYAQQVRNCSIRREAIQFLAEQQEALFEGRDDPRECIDRAQGGLVRLQNESGGVGQGLVDMSDAMTGAVNALEAIRNRKGMEGVKSGYPDLDKILHGFAPGRLYTIFADVSGGKTSFALNLSANVAKQDDPVLFMSLEMTSNEVALRLLCREAGNGVYNLAKNEDQGLQMRHAVKISRWPLFVDDLSGATPDHIRRRAHEVRYKNGGKLGMVILDYIQIAEPNEKQRTRERDIASISAGNKRLAKDLGVPVVQLSQVNRVGAKRTISTNILPTLNDLRDSGAIEADSDVCIAIGIPEVIYKQRDLPCPIEALGTAKLAVVKNRHGPLGSCDLAWFGEGTRIESLSTYSTDWNERAEA